MNFEDLLNKNVNQDNIGDTICKSGYTKIIRPSTKITNKIKYMMMEFIFVNKSKAHEYVLDHKIALSLGGHPSNEGNLQLITLDEGFRKNKLESKLRCLVCSKIIRLVDAQKAIYQDWKSAYNAYL